MLERATAVGGCTVVARGVALWARKRPLEVHVGARGGQGNGRSRCALGRASCTGLTAHGAPLGRARACGVHGIDRSRCTVGARVHMIDRSRCVLGRPACMGLTALGAPLGRAGARGVSEIDGSWSARGRA